MYRYFFIFIFIFTNLYTVFCQKAKIDAKLLESGKNESQSIVVILQEQADISKVKSLRGKDRKANYVYEQLTSKAKETQKEVTDLLKLKGKTYRSFYIVNMVSLTANMALIEELASLRSVKTIIRDGNFIMIEPKPERTVGQNRGIEWNISKIKAPDVWALGFTGQNVVIGGQDTGYKWDHPALKNQYRGWNGSVADHNYNWHDAIHPNSPMSPDTSICGFDALMPCDDHNHGTHTMGTMVGDDGGGNQIGVAPGAKWIGCRNMKNGNGTLTTYVECFEWFLAPTPVGGGTADPNKMPHVINNSWGCPPSEGCDTSNYAVMEFALNNLRNAGCVVVVSAGNYGSACSTVKDAAAIFEGSFSVGSTTDTDAISGFSSRGSVTVDGSNRLKPNISAPGSSVRSAFKDNTYGIFGGTSMAGPHVAGLVALIISANPNLAGEVDKIEDIIEQTAVHLTSVQTCGSIPGTSIPNNTFGYGRIDALAAVNRALKDLYVPFIKVDQFGYRPNDEKIAILTDPQTGYNSADSYSPAPTIEVKNSSTYQVVYSGAPVAWSSGATHMQSGDKVWRFDFSTLTTPGIYHVADGNDGSIRSEDFEIKENIYDDVLKAAFKTFYYQRCGIAKAAPYAQTEYSDASCHAQDATCRFVSDPINPALYKNMSGGWHDAGDYNKYVNFAYKPINDLLWSYEINPQAWASDDMGIPESGNGLPDLLDEIKYELDWLTKMQDTDGGTFCVVGVRNYATASPPSADNAIRYYGPKTTSASLSTAASFAFAAKQFKKIDNSTAQAYASLLENKAISAWQWAVANPADTYYNANIIAAGEQEVSTYDRDMLKLTAAVYLYDITGDNTYKTYVESNYNTAHLMAWNFVYPFENVTQLSLLHYSHLKGVSSGVATNIKNAYRYSMDNSTDNFPALTSDLDAYRSHIKSENIVWGSNATKCNQGNLFQAYHHFNLNISKNLVAEKTISHFVHYMHGVNPNALTYLTNMAALGADRSVNTINHAWFTEGSTLWDDVRTSTYGPAPGFIPGGPNPSWSLDGCCPSGCGSTLNNNLCVTLSPPSGQPALKSYKDWNTGWPQNSWSVTENAIYYQSSYLFLLSSMVNKALDNVTTEKQVTINSDLFLNTMDRSIVLTSPNNTKYRIIVNNAGILSTLLITSVTPGSTKAVSSSLNMNTSENGVILRSPDNSLWKISIGKAGELKTSVLPSVSGNHTQLPSGDFLIDDYQNGLILKDQNNICYLINVSNSGVLFTKPTICHD